MRRTLMGLMVLGTVLLAAVAVGGVREQSPAGAATGEAPVMGYTLKASAATDTCELVTVDWATAAITDLPAVPSGDACAYDLAVAPDGTVYGFLPDEFLPDSVPSALIGSAPPVGHLITYAADGTPTRTVATLPQYYYRAPGILGIYTGLAIDTAGTFYVILNGLWANVETCQPAMIPNSLPESATEPAEDSMDAFVPCLFTLDPATGALTLVGSTRLIDGDHVGLSIGSDGSWSLAVPDSYPPRSIESNEPREALPILWSSIDRATGEGTPGVNYFQSNGGLFDQLRTRPTVFAIIRDEATDGWMTATVDPTTGAITPIAPLQIPPDELLAIVGVVELPEPDVPRFTG